jgi:hypothetical protein
MKYISNSDKKELIRKGKIQGKCWFNLKEGHIKRWKKTEEDKNEKKLLLY